ncbi:hypothetical protein BH23BAC1_BH23BAC1_19530 [soil metagenome]
MESEENNFDILDKAIEKYTEEINFTLKIIYFYSIISIIDKKYLLIKIKMIRRREIEIFKIFHYHY